MPYRSAKQRAFMHIHHPEIAKRWDSEYGGAIHPSDDTPKKKALRKRMKMPKINNLGD